MFPDPGLIPEAKGYFYMLRFCVYIVSTMELKAIRQQVENLEHLFYYAFYLEHGETGETTDTLQTLLSTAACSQELLTHLSKEEQNNTPVEDISNVDGLYVWEHICLKRSSFQWLAKMLPLTNLHSEHYDLMLIAVKSD
jgi:hypothetical protein